MNSLVVLAFIVLLQFGQSTVNGAPTWIPSNVTFSKLNETHVQIKYKDKVIETFTVEEYNANTSKPHQIQTDSDRRQSDTILQENTDRFWIRVNLCYFNPVTCFAGNRQ